MEKTQDMFTSIPSDALLRPSLATRVTCEDRSISRPPVPSQQVEMHSQNQNKDKESDVCGQCGDPQAPTATDSSGKDNLRLEATFPWLVRFRERCVAALVSPSIKGLDELMGYYFKNVEKDVKSCYMKPNRAAKLKRSLLDAILFFYSLYNHLQPVDNTFYLEKTSDLLAFYIDMELKASRRGKETAKTIASRISCCLFLFLEKSRDCILESILKTKLVVKGFREICIPLLDKVLQEEPGFSNSSEMSYVRHILVYKMLKKIVKDATQRKRISNLAVSRLKVPIQLRDSIRSGLLSGLLPNIPKARKDITNFFMQAKFDMKEKTKEFLKLERCSSENYESMSGGDKLSFFDTSALDISTNTAENSDNTSVSELLEEIALDILRPQAITEETIRLPHNETVATMQEDQIRTNEGEFGRGRFDKVTKRTRPITKVCRKEPLLIDLVEDEELITDPPHVALAAQVEERHEVRACADSTVNIEDVSCSPAERSISSPAPTVMDTTDLDKVRIKVENVTSPPDCQESAPQVPEAVLSCTDLDNTIPEVSVKVEDVSTAESSCLSDPPFAKSSSEVNTDVFNSVDETPVVHLDDELCDKVHVALSLNEKNSQWRSQEGSKSRITVSCFTREKLPTVGSYIMQRSMIQPSMKLNNSLSYRFGESGYSASLVVKSLLSGLFFKGALKEDGTFSSVDCKKLQASTSAEVIDLTHSIENVMETVEKTDAETLVSEEKPRKISTFLCVCDDVHRHSHADSDKCSEKTNQVQCDITKSEADLQDQVEIRVEENQPLENDLGVLEEEVLENPVSDKVETELTDVMLDINTVAQEVEVISEPKEEPSYVEDEVQASSTSPISYQALQEAPVEPEKVPEVEKKVPSIKIKISQNSVQVEPEIKRHKHDKRESTDSNSSRKESKKAKSKRKHRDREHRHSKHEKEHAKVIPEATNIEEPVKSVTEDDSWVHLVTCKLDVTVCKHQFMFRELYSTRNVPPNIPAPYLPHAEVQSSQGKTSPRCPCLQCSENFTILLTNYKSLVQYLNVNSVKKSLPRGSDESGRPGQDHREEKTDVRFGVSSEQDSSLPLKKRKTMTNMTSDDTTQQKVSNSSLNQTFNYQSPSTSTVNVKTEVNYSEDTVFKNVSKPVDPRPKASMTGERRQYAPKARNPGLQIAQSGRNLVHPNTLAEQLASKDIRDPRVLKRLRWEDQNTGKRKEPY